MEKFKHNTTGKFHNINLMVQNLEKGRVQPKEGYGAIHETVVTMINTSREQYRDYSGELLVIVKDKDEAIKLIGQERADRLKALTICEQNLSKESSSERAVYFWYVDKTSNRLIYWLGQITSQIPIRKILMNQIPTELYGILIDEKIEVDSFLNEIEESERLRG